MLNRTWTIVSFFVLVTILVVTWFYSRESKILRLAKVRPITTLGKTDTVRDAVAFSMESFRGGILLDIGCVRLAIRDNEEPQFSKSLLGFLPSSNGKSQGEFPMMSNSHGWNQNDTGRIQVNDWVIQFENLGARGEFVISHIRSGVVASDKSVVFELANRHLTLQLLSDFPESVEGETPVIFLIDLASGRIDRI